MFLIWSRKLATKAAILMAAFTLTGCFFTEEIKVQHFFGRALGTSYNVRFVGTELEVRKYQSGVDKVLEEINESMSTYLPDSELNQFNDHIGTDWFEISEQLGDVLQLSHQISELSGGAFDVTVGPLVDLWGFGPEARREQIPEPQVLNAVFSEIGYTELQLSENASKVKKLRPRRIDLSAIAKGYSVDKIADYLSGQGVDNFLIEVGGEMRLKGVKPGNEKWRVAIETPESGARGIFKILPITDVAIATSGDYRNYFEIDGVRYSHTIDPSTGYPIKHNLASITVITTDCASADAWATAMMVMGTKRSLELAEQLNLAIFLIEKSGNEFIEYSSSAYDLLATGGS